ncbi:hypothetical protein [Agarivorans sp. Alg241-V36]|uniref:hypothetical protein n=1 Tax=Agarivorans sp. Alg241-V36 TaxID=2305992 RepID=UPI0013D4F655|nr:hypothetical protein [Agarivorans sp. Alg241-V36]
MRPSLIIGTVSSFISFAAIAEPSNAWHYQQSTEQQLSYAELVSQSGEVSLIFRCIQGELDSLIRLADGPLQPAYHYMNWQFLQPQNQLASFNVLYHHFDEDYYQLGSGYNSWFELYLTIMQHSQMRWSSDDFADIEFSYHASDVIGQVIQDCPEAFQASYDLLAEQLSQALVEARNAAKHQQIIDTQQAIEQLVQSATQLAQLAQVPLRISD